MARHGRSSRTAFRSRAARRVRVPAARVAAAAAASGRRRRRWRAPTTVASRHAARVALAHREGRRWEVLAAAGGVRRAPPAPPRPAIRRRPARPTSHTHAYGARRREAEWSLLFGPGFHVLGFCERGAAQRRAPTTATAPHARCASRLARASARASAQPTETGRLEHRRQLALRGGGEEGGTRRATSARIRRSHSARSRWVRRCAGRASRADDVLVHTSGERQTLPLERLGDRRRRRGGRSRRRSPPATRAHRQGTATIRATRPTARRRWRRRRAAPSAGSMARRRSGASRRWVVLRLAPRRWAPAVASAAARAGAAPQRCARRASFGRSASTAALRGGNGAAAAGGSRCCRGAGAVATLTTLGAGGTTRVSRLRPSTGSRRTTCPSSHPSTSSRAARQTLAAAAAGRLLWACLLSAARRPICDRGARSRTDPLPAPFLRRAAWPRAADALGTRGGLRTFCRPAVEVPFSAAVQVAAFGARGAGGARRALRRLPSSTPPRAAAPRRRRRVGGGEAGGCEACGAGASARLRRSGRVA